MIHSVCCVCGLHYGDKPDGRDYVSISHGYCSTCYLIELAKIYMYEPLDENAVSIRAGR